MSTESKTVSIDMGTSSGRELDALVTTEVMNWTAVGSILMALAVAAGAFGAHGLRARLDAYSMSVYEKAVFYHFVHALGILLIALLARTNAVSVPGAGRAAGLLLIGIIIFSGSLYVLAVTGIRILGAITPIGGVAFIAGWLLLAYDAARVQRF